MSPPVAPTVKRLELFSQNPERIYSREQIMDRAYKDFRILSDRTVDSHIRNLRRKLKPLALDQAIQSIYGEGYKYVPPEQQ